MCTRPLLRGGGGGKRMYLPAFLLVFSQQIFPGVNEIHPSWASLIWVACGSSHEINHCWIQGVLRGYQFPAIRTASSGKTPYTAHHLPASDLRLSSPDIAQKWSVKIYWTKSVHYGDRYRYFLQLLLIDLYILFIPSGYNEQCSLFWPSSYGLQQQPY